MDQAKLYYKPGEVSIDWDGPAGVAEEANRRLALIAPPSNTINWLYAYWEPGEPWQPVERLIIAEMTPRSILAGEDAFYRLMGEADPESLFAELEGPNPRWSGHYDKYLGRFVYDGLPPNITQRQWLLWRSHRAYARAFWCVQGPQGGHKINLNEIEKRILKFHGRPTQTPLSGDPRVPFARFDDRILDKLQAMDKLQKWMERNAASWKDRTAKDRNFEKIQALEEIDRTILDWLDSQIVDFSTRDLGSNRTTHAA
jgi:hypothetical protein